MVEGQTSRAGEGARVYRSSMLLVCVCVWALLCAPVRVRIVMLWCVGGAGGGGVGWGGGWCNGAMGRRSRWRDWDSWVGGSGGVDDGCA